jgi:hypothetical protein
MSWRVHQLKPPSVGFVCVDVVSNRLFHSNSHRNSSLTINNNRGQGIYITLLKVLLQRDIL